MALLLPLLLVAALFVFSALTGKWRLVRYLAPAAVLCVLAHAPALFYLLSFAGAGSAATPAPQRFPLWKGVWSALETAPPVLHVLLTALLAGVLAGALLWLHLFPVRVKNAFASLRVRILYGGRALIYWGLFLVCTQALFYPAFLGSPEWQAFPRGILITDAVFCVLFCVLPLLNGTLRVLCACRRLNIVMRLLVILTWWVPLWGLFLLFYCAHKAAEEYDHECIRAAEQHVRANCDVCKTRYPIVLVHGVGFRDLRYFNYWGRIPKLLLKNGATLFYGNQEAWGTVEANAADLKVIVESVLREQQCEKVNIIAHSKGGLDSRCMISELGMGEHVASLTTISTPHHGSRVIDRVVRMPKGLYRRIARMVNASFGKLGDKNPDFYTASHQFTTAYAEEFSRRAPDVPGVYYQSYASVMGGPLSDCILTVPYCILRPLLGENDGLVDVESAKWGEFRGVFRATGRRGVSHGDMIDLHRDDYKGFDVAARYVDIVSELREKGF